MIKLSLIAALAVYYLYVGLLILNPAVSDEYRAYYIDAQTNIGIRRTRTLNLDRLELGRAENHDSERVVFDNWWSPEDTLRWSKKESGILFFLAPDTVAAASGRLAVAYMIQAREAVVELRLNKQPIGKWLLEQEGVLEVPFDPSLLREKNVLTFHFLQAKRASWQDARIIGIALRSLTIE